MFKTSLKFSILPIASLLIIHFSSSSLVTVAQWAHTYSKSFNVLNSDPTTWQRVYIPPDFPNTAGWAVDICPADSGNFYIVNALQPTPFNVMIAYIMKINPYGDTLWTKVLDSLCVYSVVASNDGGCIITCSKPVAQKDLVVLKLSTTGSIIWMKTYFPGKNEGILEKIFSTKHNKYIISGNINQYYGAIIKIDSLGNIIWLKQYRAGSFKSYYTVCEAQGNGYLAAGEQVDAPFENGYGVVSRVDDNGDLIWERMYSLFGCAISFNTVYPVQNGYLLSGIVYDTIIDRSVICILRVDTLGNPYFTKLIPDDTLQLVIFSGLNVINGNRYFINIYRHSELHDDSGSAKIILTDSSGSTIRYKTFRQSRTIFFNSSFINNENDLILVGGSMQVDPDHLNIYAVRTDTGFSLPPIGLREQNKSLPHKYKLSQNYPNPFNPTTKIKFDISAVGTGRDLSVQLRIYDILGREVATLVNEQLKPGSYEVEWDGSNYPSEVYFYKLSSESFSNTKKMVLIK